MVCPPSATTPSFPYLPCNLPFLHVKTQKKNTAGKVWGPHQKVNLLAPLFSMTYGNIIMQRYHIYVTFLDKDFQTIIQSTNR